MATKTPATKPSRGLSLNIGLNSVSTSHYGGWSGDLSACEFDAKDMAALATGRGMKATVLLTKDGTRAKVLGALRSAAKALVKGDFFFLTYSGHGGQVPDVSGEEADKLDETWCLYDGQLFDDELYLELGKFAAGVRILVASTEIGQGQRTVHAQIVAETLGIPLHRVEVEAADTAFVPNSGPTVASRTTMVVGGLLKRCADEMRERLGSLSPSCTVSGVPGMFRASP
jgi:hypothetical protein